MHVPGGLGLVPVVAGGSGWLGGSSVGSGMGRPVAVFSGCLRVGDTTWAYWILLVGSWWIDVVGSLGLLEGNFAMVNVWNRTSKPNSGLEHFQ